MNDFQFYPTPLSLAKKAWAKFKDRDFKRVLEPSAGTGALIKGMPHFDSKYGSTVPVDCIEIDITKHAQLRELPGVQVVGFDFMKFGGGLIHSHAILNPPFRSGVQHVLRVWDNMFDGEIVAILNAETLKNPCSREREHLVRLVELNGEVEFITQAFVGDDVERETEVEVALVYLRKKSNVGEDIARQVLDDLKVEDERLKVNRLAEGYKEPQELVIPATVVENHVLAFEAAVKAMRDAVVAEARANRCADLIGRTMAEMVGEFTLVKAEVNSAWVRSTIESRYLGLKDRAWANLLRSSKVEKHLSSSARKRMESIFSTEIAPLDFTVENVNGFLAGLVENQGSIMRQMACDVFDLIVRWHSENVVFYKGWASNDRHRTCGMRLKKTRFVIPGNTSYAGSKSLSYDAERRLADFDRVLAMLDGKEEPEFGLVAAFRTRMSDLLAGERVSSSYLDVRYFPGAGTIHFFPKSQTLMDKLNRLVGEHRQWLPPQTEHVSEDFVKQFSDADRFDKQVREELTRARSGSIGNFRSDDPLRNVFSSDESQKAHEAIYDALTTAHAAHGISVDYQLQYKQDAQGLQLLIAA